MGFERSVFCQCAVIEQSITSSQALVIDSVEGSGDRSTSLSPLFATEKMKKVDSSGYLKLYVVLESLFYMIQPIGIV